MQYALLYRYKIKMLVFLKILLKHSQLHHITSKLQANWHYIFYDNKYKLLMFTSDFHFFYLMVAASINSICILLIFCELQCTEIKQVYKILFIRYSRHNWLFGFPGFQHTLQANKITFYIKFLPVKYLWQTGIFLTYLKFVLRTTNTCLLLLPKILRFDYVGCMNAAGEALLQTNKTYFIFSIQQVLPCIRNILF